MLANSGDPDQTPRFAASDLGLRCLPTSHKKDAMLISEFEQKFYNHILQTNPGLVKKGNRTLYTV